MQASTNLGYVPVLHVRVSDELHDKVRAAAEADRRSVSNWVALAAERALEQDHATGETGKASA